MSNVYTIEAKSYTTPSGVNKGQNVTYTQRLKEIDTEKKKKKAMKNIKTAAKKAFGHTDYIKTGMFR
tara:strand:- start:1826 stop:2026 length:201 start_codon:yes stop_codon:yes gene_type:complete